MYETIDSRFSKSFGIDNDLCLPHRSISFWSLTALAVIDLLEVHRHFTHARLELIIAVTVLVPAIVAILYRAKVKVHELSKTTEPLPDANTLCSISRFVSILAGAALWACFAAMFFLL